MTVLAIRLRCQFIGFTGIARIGGSFFIFTACLIISPSSNTASSTSSTSPSSNSLSSSEFRIPSSESEPTSTNSATCAATCAAMAAFCLLIAFNFFLASFNLFFSSFAFLFSNFFFEGFFSGEKFLVKVIVGSSNNSSSSSSVSDCLLSKFLNLSSVLAHQELSLGGLSNPSLSLSSDTNAAWSMLPKGLERV